VPPDEDEWSSVYPGRFMPAERITGNFNEMQSEFAFRQHAVFFAKMDLRLCEIHTYNNNKFSFI
jgi:hypothetical protein